MNPKRFQRQVKRYIEKARETAMPSTTAQGYMRQELEQNKRLKKKIQSAEKRAYQLQQFALNSKRKKLRTYPNKYFSFDR
jgi:methylthioribose-1-phosphate isomerase